MRSAGSSQNVDWTKEPHTKRDGSGLKRDREKWLAASASTRKTVESGIGHRLRYQDTPVIEVTIHTFVPCYREGAHGLGTAKHRAYFMCERHHVIHRCSRPVRVMPIRAYVFSIL